jgi:hypothetical protein
MSFMSSMIPTVSGVRGLGYLLTNNFSTNCKGDSILNAVPFFTLCRFFDFFLVNCACAFIRMPIGHGDEYGPADGIS